MVMKRALLVAGSAALAGASMMLTGCTGPQPVPPVPTNAAPVPVRTLPVREDPPTPNPHREEEYRAALSQFPYALPTGASFPTTVPAYDYPANVKATDSGAVVAYHWWGCSLLNAAWDAAAEGDDARASSLFSVLEQAVDADAPGLSAWDTSILNLQSAEAPNMGESGLCRQWFDIIDG